MVMHMRLRIEIVISRKGLSAIETLAYVTDLQFSLAFCLGSGGSASPDPKDPVIREALELLIHHERPNRVAAIERRHGLHPVEQHSVGTPSNVASVLSSPAITVATVREA